MGAFVDGVRRWCCVLGHLVFLGGVGINYKVLLERHVHRLSSLFCLVGLWLDNAWVQDFKSPRSIIGLSIFLTSPARDRNISFGPSRNRCYGVPCRLWCGVTRRYSLTDVHVIGHPICTSISLMEFTSIYDGEDSYFLGNKIQLKINW